MIFLERKTGLYSVLYTAVFNMLNNELDIYLALLYLVPEVTFHIVSLWKFYNKLYKIDPSLFYLKSFCYIGHYLL